MIEKKQFDDIVTASADYKYTSINHLENEEPMGYEVLKMDDSIILLIRS